jgi:hypothetical protein
MTDVGERARELLAADVDRVAQIISPDLWGSPFAYPDGIECATDLEHARMEARHKATQILTTLPARTYADGVEDAAKIADERDYQLRVLSDEHFFRGNERIASEMDLRADLASDLAAAIRTLGTNNG